MHWCSFKILNLWIRGLHFHFVLLSSAHADPPSTISLHKMISGYLRRVMLKTILPYGVGVVIGMLWEVTSDFKRIIIALFSFWSVPKNISIIHSCYYYLCCRLSNEYFVYHPVIWHCNLLCLLDPGCLGPSLLSIKYGN